MQRTRRWSLAGASFGAGLGLLVGAGLLTAVSVASVARPRSAPPRLEATHLPPLLTAAGEPVVLRYDVYCVGADDPAAACDAGGIVYARNGDSGPFQPLPLRLDPGALEGRYAVHVPEALARSGFSYYAVLRDARTGVSTELPVGAPDALERSTPLAPSAAVVRLGGHVFGSVRAADARVVSAGWGDGSGDVGLEERGPDAAPIGASSFDVDSAGRVTVLDEAHRRLLRWSPGISAPDAVSVPVSGTIADVASGPGGATYVLDSGGRGSHTVLRAFDARGLERAAVQVGDQAEAVRAGPDGPVVLEPQSARWSSPGPRGAGGVGRPLGGALRLIVYRPEAVEVRVATVTDSGSIVRSWRIESTTAIGEVQLAEPVGPRLVVVLRVYDERHAEFVALVLGIGGVEQQFSLDASDWAESAPLGHFRLAGGSLYRLGSTPRGMFVDRYDLGVS